MRPLLESMAKAWVKHGPYFLYVVIPFLVAVILSNIYPYYAYPPWREGTIYPYEKGEIVILITLSFYLSFVVLSSLTIYPVIDLCRRLLTGRLFKVFSIISTLWCSTPFIIGLFTVVTPLHRSAHVDLERALHMYNGFNTVQTIYSVELFLNIPLFTTVLLILYVKRYGGIPLLRIVKTVTIVSVITYVLINAAMLTQLTVDLNIARLGHEYLYLYFRGFNRGIVEIMNKNVVLGRAIIPTWGFTIGILLWSYLLKRTTAFLVREYIL